MARKFITPSKDATLYEEYSSRNSGFDEVLDVGKDDSGQNAMRSIIQFDVSELSEASESGANFYLNLTIAHAYDLQANQVIEFVHVSESWDEGTGYLAQEFANPQDGVSWDIRNAAGTQWTGSGASTTSIADTLTFGWEPKNVRLDITGIVNAWLTGSFNNGLLIKVPEADENNIRVRSKISFFSKQTHTIFPPTIEAVWSTQNYDTGSAAALNPVPEDYEIFMTNLRPYYMSGSTARFRFGMRDCAPMKTFSDSFRFGNKYYLPQDSYVGIQDAGTLRMVIPFDSGSLISLDASGSYADLKMENMFINRSYRVLVRTMKPWGYETIDTGQTFRIR